MSYTKVSEEKRQLILSTIDDIIESGDTPSQKAIQAIIGGSFSHISPVFREWKAQQLKAPTIDLDMDIPQELSSIIEKHVSYIAGSFKEVMYRIANDRIEAGVAQAMSSHRSMLDQLNNVEEEKGVVLHKLEKLEANLEMKNELVIRLDADIKEKKSEITHFNDALDELEGSLRLAQNEKKDFEHLHKLSQERVKTLQATIRDLEAQLEIEREALKDRDSMISELKDSAIKAKEDFDNVLTEQSSRYESELSETLKLHESVRNAQIENHKSEMSELAKQYDSKLEEMAAKVDSLSHAKIDLEKQNHVLTVLQAATKESFDKLDARMEERNEQIQKLIRIETEFNALKPSLADKNAEIALLNKRVTLLQDKLDDNR